MADFPPLFYAVIRRIDRFTDWTGKIVALAMLFLVFSISYECFSRYILSAPTISFRKLPVEARMLAR